VTETLRDRLGVAAAEKDALGLSAALADYVEGVAEVAFDGAPGELDLDPRCFAVVDERTVYLPDRAIAITSVGAALLDRVEDHRAFPMVVQEYVDAIVRRLDGAARRTEVGASIEAYAARSETSAAVRERLLDVLGRRRRPERLARIAPLRPRDRTPPAATAIPVAPHRKPTMRTLPPMSRPDATPPAGLPAPRHPTPMPQPLAPLSAVGEPVHPPRIEPLAPAGTPSLTMMTDLPPSFVWPPTARDVLRGIVAHASGDGEERDGQLTHEIDGWSLRTPLRRSFGDGMHGRAELHRLARAHASLGTLGSAHTFLVLAPGSGGQLWLWRVARVGRSLRALMHDAAERRDAGALGQLLGRYAAAVVEGLVLSRRARLVDLGADAFAVEDEVTVYTGDDVVAPRGVGVIGQVALGLLDDLDAAGGPMGGVMDGYVAAYERLIPRRLSRADMDSMDLRRSLASASLETAVAREARERLTKLMDAGWAE
jgi:hypothetical protein